MFLQKKKKKVNMCNNILYLEETKNCTVYFKLLIWKKMVYNLGYDLIRVATVMKHSHNKGYEKDLYEIFVHSKRVTEEMIY